MSKKKELKQEKSIKKSVNNKSLTTSRQKARMTLAVKLGRVLTSREIVHHIDENSYNNDPANLMLMPSNRAHKRFHTTGILSSEDSDYNQVCNPTSESWSRHNARIVMAVKLGRVLKSSEIVHHIDGDLYNNDPENLRLFASSSEHTKFHNKQDGGPMLGKRHTESTKEKMRKNSATKGKTGKDSPVYGIKRSKETRERMSRAQKGRTFSEETKKKMGQHRLGKKHTKESIEKMRQAKLGKTLTEEHKNKIGDAQRGTKNHMYGKVGADNPFYKKKHSEESKAKISAGCKAAWAARKQLGG